MPLFMNSLYTSVNLSWLSCENLFIVMGWGNQIAPELDDNQKSLHRTWMRRSRPGRIHSSSLAQATAEWVLRLDRRGVSKKKPFGALYKLSRPMRAVNPDNSILSPHSCDTRPGIATHRHPPPPTATHRHLYSTLKQSHHRYRRVYQSASFRT
jgi:hypothetical protein